MASQPMVNPPTDIESDAEYMRLKALRDEIEQAMMGNVKFGQSTSSEGNAATFYSRADLQMMYDNYTTKMNRRASEITIADGIDADPEFGQAIILQLPKY